MRKASLRKGKQVVSSSHYINPTKEREEFDERDVVNREEHEQQHHTWEHFASHYVTPTQRLSLDSSIRNIQSIEFTTPITSTLSQREDQEAITSSSADFINGSTLIFTHHELDLFDTSFVNEITEQYLPQLCTATQQSPYLIPYDQYYFVDKSQELRQFLFVSESDKQLTSVLIEGQQHQQQHQSGYTTLEQLIFTRSQGHLASGDLFTVEEIMHTLKSIATGLQTLHQYNITHKNIIPKNILVLSDSNRIILSNYGIGFEKMIDMLTENDLYLAPEILEQSRFSNKSDIYALAVVMLKMLTLRDVTVEFTDTFAQEIRQEIHDRYQQSSDTTFYTLVELLLRSVSEDEAQRPDLTEILDVTETESVTSLAELEEFDNMFNQSSSFTEVSSHSAIAAPPPPPPVVISPMITAIKAPMPFRASGIVSEIPVTSQAQQKHTEILSDDEDEQPEFDQDIVKEESSEQALHDFDRMMYPMSQSMAFQYSAPQVKEKKQIFRMRRSSKKEMTFDSSKPSEQTEELARSAKDSDISREYREKATFGVPPRAKGELSSYLTQPSLQEAPSLHYSQPKPSLFSSFKNLFFRSNKVPQSNQGALLFNPPINTNETLRDNRDRTQTTTTTTTLASSGEVPSQPKRKDLYQIIERIGMGTQGSCLLVKRDGVQYAMKRYKQGHDSEFHNELSILKMMRHPRLVSVIEHFSEKDDNNEDMCHYVIMEYCSKGDLAKFLLRNYRRKPMPQDKFLKLSKEILNGLAYMHEKGYGHFDLKPANIFLTEDTSVKLGDFGFSAKFGQSVLGGSQEYIAPEQTAGSASNKGSAKFDMYAFGTVCLEMLTRKKRDLKLEMRSDKWLDTIWERECASIYHENLLGLLKLLLSSSPHERPSAIEAISSLDQIEKDVTP